MILSRCGYRCDLCLAYRENVEADRAVQQILSDGWHTYFGFRIPADQVICDGCRATSTRLIDTSCPVRPCAIERGLDTCAACPDYVCARLAERLVLFDEVAARIGHAIPEEDRRRFIAPYENRARLDELRGHATGGVT